MAAQLLTAWALLLDVATFATNDYRLILLQAIGCAVIAMLLVALVFHRVPRFHRPVCVVLVFVDLFVIWNAAFERGLAW